ncbi:transcription factor kayak isoform X2 [Cylas formicarius]|uniref:transcription factor kayak isoform X2 n=1 Tax=Cylas formicarius TaxID=197179 RepID=UPI002958A423|nr:transcription factor kayak isoform X2 [Cylas formicarius]
MSQLVPFLNFGLDESEFIHDSEMMYSENYFGKPNKMFITLEGLNSGVPTRTTPTLTPTTLRNIEQTFIELQSKPEQHENEARFVPPLVHSIGNNQYISASDANDIYSASNTKSPLNWHSSLSQSSSDSNTRSTPPLTKSNAVNNVPTGTTRRNMGGRKPNKDLSLSPEEEERRRIRRERNKAAAARCRKRRVDHTNSLIKEVEDLEQKRQKLLDEQQNLKILKDQLEYALENHMGVCRKQTQSPPEIKPFDHLYNNKFEKVKTEVIEPHNDVFLLPSPTKKIMLSSTVPISKPNRPNSLNVASTVAPTSKNIMSEILGVPISTPSTGMVFNFESLMGGGTGLTPVSGPVVPSCSSQQRNLPVSIADISSPDTCGPPKLVSL